MFEKLSAAPNDPILGLFELYKNDPRPNKINLGIGLYQDETGQTPVLNSVKKTEQYLLDHETTKSYLKIEGIDNYATATQILLFGADSEIITEQRTYTAQTPGGTGALRIAADLAASQLQVKRAWISTPTWPNHHCIFQAAGIDTATYRYYDAENQALDFSGLLADLQQAQAGDIVILHGCSHNPTGIDPTSEQWQQLAEFCAERQLLPLFDFAYQGLAHGLDEDAEGLRIFARFHPELLIASSYSKNFGLYKERVGALTLVAQNRVVAETTFSQIKSVIRANYSNPPAHGGEIVATILNTPTLRALWQQELTDMRQRIQRMRQLFVNTLIEKGAKRDYSFILQQNGMFSYSGLTKEQVNRLRDEHALYIVDSGRINIAGMTLDNMAILCEAIVAVE